MATLMYDGRELTTDDATAGGAFALAIRAANAGTVGVVAFAATGDTPATYLLVGTGIPLGVTFDSYVPTSVRDAAGKLITEP